MSVYYKPRVSEQGVLLGGTGPYTLPQAAAPGGYQTFNTALTSGTQYMVCILDSVAFSWELSVFTFTSPATITRTTFHASSTGSPVNFSTTNTLVISVDHPEATPDSSVAYSSALASLNANAVLDPSIGGTGTAVNTFGKIPSLGSLQNGFVNLTSATTLTAAQGGCLIELGGASALTVTFPTVVNDGGLVYHFFNYGTASWTLAAGVSALIYGNLGTAVSSVLLAPQQVVYAICDGSNWLVIAEGLPLIGATAGANAAAGNVGEYISSTVSTPIAIASSTPTTITSITLTPGDWDVFGQVGLINTGVNITIAVAGISLANNTQAANTQVAVTTGPSMGQFSASVPPLRANITTSTTYYLVGSQQYAAGTGTAVGYIAARRRR